MLKDIYNWFFSNPIETVGTITGLIYLFLSIKQNIWCWIFGIISSFLYIIVFFNIKLYADMVLNFYYVIVGFYGWYHWLYGANSGKQGELSVSRLSKSLLLKLSVISVLSYVLVSFLLIKIPVLINIPAAELPYFDAFTTVGAFVATWMMARKILENWLLWIVVDIIALGMYIYKGIYGALVLFAVYSVMAIVGYIEWKKDFRIVDQSD